MLAGIGPGSLSIVVNIALPPIVFFCMFSTCGRCMLSILFIWYEQSVLWFWTIGRSFGHLGALHQWMSVACQPLLFSLAYRELCRSSEHAFELNINQLKLKFTK
jgi:hypothetical protein